MYLLIFEIFLFLKIHLSHYRTSNELAKKLIKSCGKTWWLASKQTRSLIKIFTFLVWNLEVGKINHAHLCTYQMKVFIAYLSLTQVVVIPYKLIYYISRFIYWLLDAFLKWIHIDVIIFSQSSVNAGLFDPQKANLCPKVKSISYMGEE